MSKKDDNLTMIFGGEAGNDDNPEGQGEPKAPEAGEPENDNSQPERLYAGKFKSVEELEKAYEEAQRWGTQRSQETAELKRELEQLRQAVAPDMTTRQQQQWRQYVQQAINAAVVDENPEQLLQLIDYMIEQKAEAKFQQRYQDLAPVVEQQRFQSEINTFLAENPEAGEYIDDMVKLIEKEPDLVTKPGWLEKAYARVLKQKISAAQKVGAENAAKTQAAKQAASMPGSAARKTQEQKNPDDELLDQIFSSSEPGGIFG